MFETKSVILFIDLLRWFCRKWCVENYENWAFQGQSFACNFQCYVIKIPRLKFDSKYWSGFFFFCSLNLSSERMVRFVEHGNRDSAYPTATKLYVDRLVINYNYF